ncbi:MAG: hypothetical protein AB4426_34920 [Xenococcaceae cyanobacterium]
MNPEKSPQLPKKKNLSDPPGFSTVDLLTLPEEERRIVQWMMRQSMIGHSEVTAMEVAAHIGEEEEIAHTRLESLVEQGLLQKLNETEERYKLRHGRKQKRRPRSGKIWQALEQ